MTDMETVCQQLRLFSPSDTSETSMDVILER